MFVSLNTFIVNDLNIKNVMFTIATIEVYRITYIKIQFIFIVNIMTNKNKLSYVVYNAIIIFVNNFLITNGDRCFRFSCFMYRKNRFLHYLA